MYEVRANIQKSAWPTPAVSQCRHVRRLKLTVYHRWPFLRATRAVIRARVCNGYKIYICSGLPKKSNPPPRGWKSGLKVVLRTMRPDLLTKLFTSRKKGLPKKSNPPPRGWKSGLKIMPLLNNDFMPLLNC